MRDEWESVGVCFWQFVVISCVPVGLLTKRDCRLFVFAEEKKRTFCLDKSGSHRVMQCVCHLLVRPR